MKANTHTPTHIQTYINFMLSSCPSIPPNHSFIHTIIGKDKDLGRGCGRDKGREGRVNVIKSNSNSVVAVINNDSWTSMY